MTQSPDDAGRGIAEVLLRAADRLSKPGAWITGYYATTASGAPCKTSDSNAACFCMVGAIAAEMGVIPGEAEGELEKRPDIRRILSGTATTLSAFNDRSSQAEVVAKLREAAAKASPPKEMGDE